MVARVSSLFFRPGAGSCFHSEQAVAQSTGDFARPCVSAELAAIAAEVCPSRQRIGAKGMRLHVATGICTFVSRVACSRSRSRPHVSRCKLRSRRQASGSLSIDRLWAALIKDRTSRYSQTTGSGVLNMILARSRAGNAGNSLCSSCFATSSASAPCRS